MNNAIYGNYSGASESNQRTPSQSAIADPDGARAALLSYGALADYPNIGVGPMQLMNGKEGWANAIAKAQPLWLGIAWQRIEVYEERLAKEQAKIERVKEATVPVLQWTEAGAIVEPGTYSAIVKEITEEAEGMYGPQLRFQFVVLDDDSDETDQQIRGWASAKWGEKTKLFKWAKSILGSKKCAPNQPIDTDKLLGKKCDLVVAARKKQDGSMGSGIEDVFPFRTVNAQVADDAPHLVPLMSRRRATQFALRASRRVRRRG